MSRRLRIAVVGDGIAGAACALFLHRQADEIVRFERAGRSFAAGAGLLLSPPGIELLRHLRLCDAALAIGAPVHIVRSQGRRARGVVDLRYRDWRQGTFGLGMHRGGLQRLLCDAADRVSQRWNTTIDGVDARNGRLRDTAGREHGPFDLVIGADGVHSRVRSTLPFRTHVKRYRWAAWLHVLEDPSSIQEGMLLQCFDGPRQAALWPIGGGMVNLSWRVECACGFPEGEGLASWKHEVGATCPAAGDLLAPLESADGFVLGTYREVRVADCVYQRVVLLGDAAHAMSPQLGQGASLALSDASTLASMRRLHATPAEALAAFRTACAPRWRRYQRLSHWLTPLFHAPSPIAAIAREALLPGFARAPPFHRAMLRTLCGEGIGAEPDDAINAPAEGSTSRRDAAA